MRKIAAILLGLLIALLCFTATAGAGSTAPSGLSASVYPHYVSGPPYTFTTTGFITFKSYYCAPGTDDPDYCTRLTAKEACSGTVSVVVSLGKDTKLDYSLKEIASATGEVNGKCEFRIRTKLDRKYFMATSHAPPWDGEFVVVEFQVKFLGNAVLSPSSARTQYVVAKVIEP